MLGPGARDSATANRIRPRGPAQLHPSLGDCLLHRRRRSAHIAPIAVALPRARTKGPLRQLHPLSYPEKTLDTASISQPHAGLLADLVLRIRYIMSTCLAIKWESTPSDKYLTIFKVFSG